MLAKTGGGILVERDSVESLAEGILSLWQDRRRAEEIGRRGAAGVREHYSASKMAQRTVEVFESVTKELSRTAS